MASALHVRFTSVHIEERRGLEFHYNVQGDETIEDHELGLELLTLGRKPFPSSKGHKV